MANPGKFKRLIQAGRDVALGKRNEYLRQRDQAQAERDEVRRQLGEAHGERNELRCQLDIALGERNELRRQLDVALGERNEFQRQLELLRITHAQHLTFKAAPPTPRSAQRSLFLATLPKSGTEFVSGAIRDATELVSPMAQWDEDLVRAYFSGYCNREDIYSTGVFVSERLLLAPFRQLTHGYLCVSHCAATHHNLCVLRDAGFERVSVLVRDPRDSTVSWTYHLRAMDPPMIEFNSLIQQLPPAYFAWPHETQLAFQVRTFLPAAVNWIEGWLRAATQAEPPVQIQLLSFDDLRRDPTALVESVLKFHRVGDYDLSKVAPPEPGKRHFREGKSGAWQEEFSAEDRQLAESLMGNRLESLFDRAAVS